MWLTRFPRHIPDISFPSQTEISEDNDAVIRMIIKRRGPNLRPISQTHRVYDGWLFFERINLVDSSISIRYVRTTEQLEDILTKGAFTTTQWKSLMFFFDTSGCRCTVSLSPNTRHFGSKLSNQSLSRLLFVVCSCKLRWAGRVFASSFRVSFADGTFHQDLVSHLAFKPTEEEIPSKTLGTEDGKEPVGTLTALDTPAFEDLVSVVRFGTETNTLAQSGRLRRLRDANRFLEEPVLQPVPASPPNTAIASTTETQAVAQVAEPVREVKASACSGLRPRRSDGQARSGAARSPREGSACTMEQLTAIHARVVTLRHAPYTDFAQLTPCGKALCYKALHELADGSVTLELDGSSGP